jgi:hypothetical protein
MNLNVFAQQLIATRAAIDDVLAGLLGDEQAEPYVTELREPAVPTLAPAPTEPRVKPCAHRNRESMVTFGAGPERFRCRDCNTIFEGAA